MLKVEGYIMFHGKMLITPKNPVLYPYHLTGTWLYKPDTGCWYGHGRSFMADICTVVEDSTAGSV